MWIVWLFYFVLHLFISHLLWLGSEEQVWLSSSSPWSLQMDLESITLVSCCGWSNRLQNCPTQRWSLSSLSLLRCGQWGNSVPGSQAHILDGERQWSRALYFRGQLRRFKFDILRLLVQGQCGDIGRTGSNIVPSGELMGRTWRWRIWS